MVEHHEKLLYVLARRFAANVGCTSKHDIDDLVQMMRAQIVEAEAKYPYDPTRTKYSTYVTNFSRNACRAWYKEMSRRPAQLAYESSVVHAEESDEVVEAGDAVPEPTVEAKKVNAKDVAAFLLASPHLSSSQKKTLQAIMDSDTLPEAGAKCGVSRQTVYNVLAKARRLLKESDE